MKTTLVRTAALVAALTLLPAFAGAADAPATDTAKVDAVLAKYVEALGGKAAIEKITNSVGKATSTVNGTEVKVEVVRAAPARLASRVEIPGMDPIREVYDGKKAWAVSPFQGSVERTGEELAKVARDAVFHQPLQMKQLFAPLTYGGAETVAGKKVEVLSAKLAGGALEKFCFSPDTGLLVRRESEYDTSGGRMKTAMTFEDYRPLDGVKQPYLIRMNLEPPGAGTMDFEMKLSEMRQNVTLPENAFAKPE